MTKYYRVRSQEQWDWLNNKLKKQGKRCASLFGSEGSVQEYLDNDSISEDDFVWDYESYIASALDVPAEDFIEVSDLMED